MENIILSPSIMCGDLVNLEKTIRILEEKEFKWLHIDLIDGVFSPSMPLGIETIRRMREITNMSFDIHIMSENNEFFIKEMLEIGVQNITFHYESSKHIEYLIKLIKSYDVEVGIALNPSTNINVLKYAIHDIDKVCLMLINPGFAQLKNEKRVSFADKKLSDLYKFIKENNKEINIQVDGRVSLEVIEKMVSIGANDLVLGSTSLFRKENTIEENKELIEEKIKNGLISKLQ